MKHTVASVDYIHINLSKKRKERKIKLNYKLCKLKLYYIKTHFKLLKCNSEIQLLCFTNPYLLFFRYFLGILEMTFLVSL